MADFDSPWKEAMDVYFEPFMAFFFPQAHAEIDWSRGYEALDKEFQQVTADAELGRRYVDKLVKVWLLSGEEQWVLAHVEIQTSEESEFARRMYVYHYRVFDRDNHVVVSFAILADDNPNWRPDSFGYGKWGCSAGLRFPVVKLLDYGSRVEELERDPNPFAILVLAHLKTMETRGDETDRRHWKTRLIKGLYQHGFHAEDVRQLFRLIDWMMDLSKSSAEAFWDEIRQFEKEKSMPFMTTPERIGMEKGLEEGMHKGIEVGLRQEFGAEGLLLLPEVLAIRDAQKLERILEAVWIVTSPEELRRFWAP